MSGNSDALQVVLGHLYCWNTKDLDGFVSYLADDVVNEVVGPKGMEIKGKSTIKDICAPLLADPNSVISIERYVADGSYVAVSLVREATDPKTGEVIRIDEADVFEVREGKIQNVTSYIFEEMFFF